MIKKSNKWDKQILNMRSDLLLADTGDEIRSESDL